jgi:hypothetical protein
MAVGAMSVVSDVTQVYAAPLYLHLHIVLATFDRQVYVHCSRIICPLECTDCCLQTVASCAGARHHPGVAVGPGSGGLSALHQYDLAVRHAWAFEAVVYRRARCVGTPVRYAVYPWIATVTQG